MPAPSSPRLNVKVSFPEIPGETFTATVSRTANSLDPASKTMQAEIDIDNKDGEIKPGMYAKVDIQLESRNQVFVTPHGGQVYFGGRIFLAFRR